MMQEWKQLIDQMNGGVAELRRGAPDIMRSFSEMARPRN